MLKKPRVCIIGCGPSGMSALHHFCNLPDDRFPDVTCYEKQSTWGGLWNQTWRTGTDEYGENVHSSMYSQLWTNIPKECIEYHDYTWDEYFGKTLPSYMPVKLVKGYLEGRLKANKNRDPKHFVRFSTVVKRVEYHQDTDKFSVRVHDLTEDTEETHPNFTHVIVASGIFSIANAPSFPGMDVFKGRIMHARDFREVSLFLGKKILIVGSGRGRSAEDLAVNGVKFGADKIICSWNTRPMGYKWPRVVEERPLVERFDENTAYFRDGSSAEIDVVVLCTGYHKQFSYLPDELRLKSKLPVPYYPENLYKGIVWMKGGKGNLFYLGAQNAIYTLPMFDIQAFWASKYITEDINHPDKNEMINDINTWIAKCSLCTSLDDLIAFQTDYLRDLCEDAGYVTKYTDARELYHSVWRYKDKNLGFITFREEQFTSIFTGKISSKPKKSWMESFDASYEAFVNQ